MTGDRIDHEVGLVACLERVREASEWERKRAAYAQQPVDALRRKGLGVACYFHGSGLGGEGHDFSVSTLAIDPDDGVTLTSGLTDYGQGSRTVFSLLAAEILGVDIRRIHVHATPRYAHRHRFRADGGLARVHCGRERGARSGGEVAATAYLRGGGRATLRAGAARARRRTLHRPRRRAVDLRRDDGARSRDGSATLGRRAAGDPGLSTGISRPGLASRTSATSSARSWPRWRSTRGRGKSRSPGCGGARRRENPLSCRGARSILRRRGAGTRLRTHGALPLRGRRPRYAGAQHVRLPRATDAPDIDAAYIQTTLREGPFGAKNLAEPVMIGAPPAIANAVFQATGQRVWTLPVTVHVRNYAWQDVHKIVHQERRDRMKTFRWITSFALLMLLPLLFGAGFTVAAGIKAPERPPGAHRPLIIDHTSTDITAIPQEWIEEAKRVLHIAYGHTSHGSQLTSGMSGLVGFANGGGLGLALPDDIFAGMRTARMARSIWDDYAMGGDVGYYPDWVNNTRTYLGDPILIPDAAKSPGRQCHHVVVVWAGILVNGSKYD